MRPRPELRAPYKPPPREPVDDAFGHWLAGFIDGEGSFVIGFRRRAGTYHTRFALCVRADDMAVIEEIVARTQIGRIHCVFTPSLRAKPNGNPAVQWLVPDKAGCVALVELLDRYPLRSKKARDFKIWRDVLADWMTTRNAAGGPARDWSTMATFKAALEDGRKYRPEVAI